MLTRQDCIVGATTAINYPVGFGFNFFRDSTIRRYDEAEQLIRYNPECYIERGWPAVAIAAGRCKVAGRLVSEFDISEAIHDLETIICDYFLTLQVNPLEVARQLLAQVKE